jgi:uncharacterized protein YlxW (UPF0749 family)
MPESPPEDSTTPEHTQPGVKGRGRMYRAVARPTRSQLVVGVLLAALGLAAVTQVRANELSNSYAGYREQDLIDILNGLSTLSERTDREVKRLEQTRDELQSTRTARQAALDQATERATTLSILAGVTPVTGPGIRVTIEPGVEQLSIDVLLDAIQELRTAGAEAIEFNDEVRIVADSALEVSGAGIYIDDELITAPYLIEAIGDPQALAGAITFSQGPQEVIEDNGGVVRVTEQDVVEVESVVILTTPEFSKSE